MSMHCCRPLSFSILFFIVLFICASEITIAQTTAFNYQGRMTDMGSPATGNYDLQFKLFDTVAVGTGTQQGSTVTVSNVSISNGSFIVTLDFGATVFDGSGRYLEIGVRQAGNTDPYVTLSPRQMLSSSPYAIRTISAAAADSLSPACVNCVTDAHIQTVDGGKITGTIAGSQISGTIPGASLPTDSPYYIQNSAALLRLGKSSVQQAASFDIDGNGAIGGNVGIGITSPLSRLHIQSGAGESLPPRAESTGTSGFAAGWDFYHSGTGKGYVGVPDAGGLLAPGEMLLFGGAGTKTSLWSGGSRVMTLTQFGNVGIGTPNPTSKLEIAAQDGLAITGFNPFLTLRDTGNGGRKSYIQGVNGDLAFIPQSFSPNGVAMVVKDVSGNVGIGLSNPSARLQVVTGNQPGIRSDSLGNAILGYSTTPSFAAIYGENLTTGSIGVYGKAGGSGIGVQGDGSPGVIGTSASGIGVYGRSTGSTSKGVYGEGDTGVWGVGNTGFNSTGVYGQGSIGVRAIATGPGGSTGVWASAVGGDPNSDAGYLDGRVLITFDTFIFGNLAVRGDKNFIEPHPTDPNKMIAYVALEGPESGTYFRGSGRIVNGVATIQVPEDFRLVTDEKGITVQVTPVGAPASIWCVRKSLDQIELRGSADVEFDFMVNGVRRLSKDHQPIVENTAFVPRSADENPFKWIDNPEVLRRLKDNGILNEDGTVNMETVKKLDFYKRTHKQEK